MEGYKAIITYSSKELTAKEQVKAKDTADCISLDECTKEGSAIFDVDYYYILEIHNEKSDNKDYTKLVIVSKDGNKYITGSEPFQSSFESIMEDMFECDEEWQLKVYRLPSKNYKDRDFLTCSVL